MLDFMIIGLPRSGTTWAANFFCTDRVLCFHDPLYATHYEDWDRELRAKSPEGAEQFVGELLVDSRTVLGDDVRKSKQFQKIMDLFKGQAIGVEQHDTTGNAWALVNSVTEFVDHHARAKTDSHRLANAWFGRGDDLKTAALERALALMA